jgi:uncharacterized RDD family membrane protein YckC
LWGRRLTGIWVDGQRSSPSCGRGLSGGHIVAFAVKAAAQLSRDADPASRRRRWTAVAPHAYPAATIHMLRGDEVSQMTEPTIDTPAQVPTQAPPAAAGPSVASATVGSRIVALIIDVVGLGFVYGIVVAILAGLGGWVGFLVSSLLYAALSIGYFVYTWTRQRATIGQRILGIETVNATDRATLTQDQAVRRWLYLFGPGTLAQVVGYGGSFLLGPVSWIIAIVVFAYEVYLLVTTIQSPTNQGFHDVQARTIVVKRSA